MSFNEKTIKPETLYQTFITERQFDDDDLKNLDLEYLTDEQTTLLMGFPVRSASIKIPYYDINGAKTSFTRVRLLNPTGKMKYCQPRASGSHIYFPQSPMWSVAKSNIGIPLIITEGEFKAHAITKAVQAEGLSHICLAVPGVSSWTDKSGLPIHKDLMAIEYERGMASRDVYILYDYDGKEDDGEPNEQVALEENKLAITLAGLGAKVHLCRIGKFRKLDGQKYAIDDHLLIGGNLTEVLMSCIEPTMIKNSEEYRLYTTRTQWAVFDGQWVRLSDGKQFNAMRIKTELANHTWVRPAPNGRTVVIKLTDAYPAWTKRLNLKGMGMYPQYQGQKMTPDGHFNFMKNWKYEPIDGPCDLWLEWCKYFFRDTPEFETFFHDWVAQIIQKPWERNNTTIQIISPHQGIGKSFIIGWISEMIGDMALSIGPDRLFERFNHHVLNRIFITVDEPSTDNARHADELKNLITSDTLTLEAKNQDAVFIKNYVNYAFTTNHAKVTTVNEGARREAIYLPQSLSPTICHDMIQQIKEWCSNHNGFHYMMHFYSTRDLSAFDPKAPAPMTEDKKQVILASKSAWAQFAQDVWDWVEHELDGAAAISKGMMTVLIRHFGYETSRLTAHNINNSFKELCSTHPRKIKNDDNYPITCLVLTRTSSDVYDIKHGSYKEILVRTNSAIEKLITQSVN